MARRYLIRDGVVITMDPAYGNLSSGDVLIEDGRIREVATRIECDECEVIPAAGKVVLPGLIDTHRHVWQSVLRYVAADWSHADYFHAIRGRLGHRFGADELYAANLAGAVEALNSGITTMLDWCHNINSPEAADAAIAGLRDSGQRTVFAYGNSNDEWNPLPNDKPLSTDVRRVRDEYFSSDDQLSTLAVCLRGPQFSTPEIAERDFALAREIAVPIQVTVGAGLWSVKASPVEEMARLGLLGDDVTYVHCNTLTDEALTMIADSGGTAAISPEVEMSMGLGYPATGRLIAHGIAPTPSVDVVPLVNGDLFGVMRMAIAAERARVHGQAMDSGQEVTKLTITAEEMLRYATLDAARTVKLDRRIGSLTPGKAADVLVIGTDEPDMFPLNHPIGAVVYGGQASKVETIFVAGEIVKRDGVLTNVDLRRVRHLAEVTRDRVLEGSGLEPGFNWEMDSKDWGALS